MFASECDVGRRGVINTCGFDKSTKSGTNMRSLFQIMGFVVKDGALIKIRQNEVGTLDKNLAFYF